MVYLITYDLHKAGRDYASVNNLLAKNQAINPMGSVWLVDSAESLVEWRNAMSEAVDDNDEVLVVRLSPGQWASYNLNAQAEAWLQSPARRW